MFDKNTVEKFNPQRTPFYYYDMDLLADTLDIVRSEAGKYGFIIHYALKANVNEKILRTISSSGFGADCVSGNEIKRALECGFKGNEIVFAGVGKTDNEIRTGLETDIFCFNVESLAELEVINEIAFTMGHTARVALRINPNIEAYTHEYITTGIEENKFGIYTRDLQAVIERVTQLKNISMVGMHFHIGSQITRLSVYKGLCMRINEIQAWFESRNIYLKHVNVGGGLGINYEDPDQFPDFISYFKLFNDLLDLRPGQSLHFEPGRSVTAQCGSLITKVLYIKKGKQTNFAIIDAGMTDLIRPALYQAFHLIENLSSCDKKQRYNVVGPICESSDSFGTYLELPGTGRGDFIAIRSTGAYGEVMVSHYNMRDMPGVLYSDEI